MMNRALTQVGTQIPQTDIENRVEVKNMGVAEGDSHVLVVSRLECVRQVLWVALKDIGPGDAAEERVIVGELLVDARVCLIVFAPGAGTVDVVARIERSAGKQRTREPKIQVGLDVCRRSR